MRYSVVIPVYRVEDYLPDCIDSVLTQETESSYEILLIDDGSPDRCGEICDEYAAQDNRIRVLHIENQGVSHARNLGVQQACGEYVLFLDSDDMWASGFLQILDRLTEDNPDMASIGCTRLYEDGRKEERKLPLVPNGESGNRFLKSLFASGKTPWFYTWSYAYRRNFLIDNNLYFPEKIKVSEDFVQIMNAIPKAESVVGCDLPLYLYRVREGSVTSNVTSSKLLDNLTTKANYFYKYPTAAMANIYANNALLVTRLDKEERKTVMPILKQNRQIWRLVSESPLKFAKALTACFGNYGGVVIYNRIRAVVRRLQGRG